MNEEHAETAFFDQVDSLTTEITAALEPIFERKHPGVGYGAIAKLLILFGKTISLEDEEQIDVIKHLLETHKNIDLSKLDAK